MAKIEIYTTALCGYCMLAKSLLKRKGLAYEEIRVDADPAQREAMLARSQGQRSVPQIFIDDAHIGGYDDLAAADRRGRLSELAQS